MANEKFDGLIEAVRLGRNGQIDFVRAYERRGVSFSDRILLDRESLLKRLKSHKRFVTGTRKELLASTFERRREVHLVTRDGREFVATRPEATGDELEGVPFI